MRFTLNPFSKQLDAFEVDVGPRGDVEFLTGDDAVPVGPDSGFNIDLLGTAAQGISTISGVNSLTWTIADAAEAQKGVSELATDAESVAGTDTVRTIVPSSLKAKLGAQTQFGLPVGTGDTAAIAWTAAPIDGQMLIGSTGVTAVLNTLTEGDGITITNGPGTVTIEVTNKNPGTGQTIGAVTADLITIPLGAVAGTYQIQASVSGFESTGPSGVGYRLTGTIRTTGAAATIIGSIDKIVNEDAALAAGNADIVISGNDAIVQVTGVAGLTIDFAATSDHVLAT